MDELEKQWQNAPDGFLDGVDFKTWLAEHVIKAEALRHAYGVLENALEAIERTKDATIAREALDIAREIVKAL